MTMEDRTTVQAITRGEHLDPFAFLGSHPVTNGVRIRTFQPGADSVAVMDPTSDEQITSLTRLHPDGVFAGTVKGADRDFRYRLRISRNGEAEVIEDPYRFGAVLGDLDLHLLGEGHHEHAYEKLGSHSIEMDGIRGVAFAVWAPNARRVSVVGDFNNWDGRCHVMRLRHGVGIWEIFLPELRQGSLYKYEIIASDGKLLPLKADPLARYCQHPPETASIVYDPPPYRWQDQAWMQSRGARSQRDAPVAIYEVHLGSWRRHPGENHRYLSYLELAEELPAYAADMGFTHIELLPVTEYPFDGSWGYQPIGLYAPTSRFGTPEEFRHLVESCHAHGLGVLMDWVPAHFPEDAHGLAQFDGTALYEHEDPAKGRHHEWGTLIYNYGRQEVSNFLLSNAKFWADEYHIDGLRVDAVASMLYLDYNREAGEWTPNEYGGNENLEAVDFLKRMNELVYKEEQGFFTTAEESTAWPMVSRPTSVGGLGFGYKWNMGWMHDTLTYIKKDPVHRRYNHNDLTFGLIYAFSENFILPLSHDEVVHGKGSLLNKMPGDRWQKFANLRVYFGFMYGHPGKKLLFMGSEFAQEREWNHDHSLDWHLLDDPLHAGVQKLIRDLNRLYRHCPSLHQLDCEPEGFQWIDGGDVENSVLSFLRRGRSNDDCTVIVCNFTPVVRSGYRVGVPFAGIYHECINTDASEYGGSGVGNGGAVESAPVPAHGHSHSLGLTLPPLAALIFACPAQRWNPGETHDQD